MNIITKESGLGTNAVRTKKAMLKYLNDTEGKTMLRTEAPIYMTAYLEKVFLYLSLKAGKYITKDDNKITYKVIKSAIKDDSSLMNMFISFLYNYDNEDSYEFTAFDSQEYTDLLAKFNKDYILTESGKNFFRYLLCNSFEKILNSSNIIKDHIKNSSISSKEIQSSIDIMYEGDLLDKIQEYARDAVTKYCKYKENSNKSKTKKSNKKKKSDNESDDESDNVSSDESDDDEKSDCDSDTFVNVKKKQKTKNTKKNAKKKKPVNNDSDNDSDDDSDDNEDNVKTC